MPDQPVESVVPEVPWDKTPMEYFVVPATDADGNPLPDAPKSYGQMVKAELEAEIERRNVGRDVVSLLSADSTKNADLIAVLEADDAATPEGN